MALGLLDWSRCLHIARPLFLGFRLGQDPEVERSGDHRVARGYCQHKVVVCALAIICDVLCLVLCHNYEVRLFLESPIKALALYLLLIINNFCYLAQWALIHWPNQLF